MINSMRDHSEITRTNMAVLIYIKRTHLSALLRLAMTLLIRLEDFLRCAAVSTSKVLIHYWTRMMISMITVIWMMPMSIFTTAGNRVRVITKYWPIQTIRILTTTRSARHKMHRK